MQVDEEDTRVKSAGQMFVENSKVQLFLLVVTLYALFADDYRTLTTQPDMDQAFDYFVLLCTLIFLAELFISVFCRPGFFNSYYFYLDVISTISLLLDYSPVRNALISFRYFRFD